MSRNYNFMFKQLYCFEICTKSPKQSVAEMPQMLDIKMFKTIEKFYQESDKFNISNNMR